MEEGDFEDGGSSTGSIKGKDQRERQGLEEAGGERTVARAFQAFLRHVDQELYQTKIQAEKVCRLGRCRLRGCQRGMFVPAHLGIVHHASSTSELIGAAASASSGDTIRLAAGVYSLTSSLRLEVEALTLEGLGTATVLDGTGMPLDGYLGMLEVRASTSFHSFMLRGSSAAFGGAIYATGADGARVVNVSSCVFEDNSATWSGGAVFATQVNMNFHSCTFARNR